MGFYIETDGFKEFESMLIEMSKMHRADLVARKLYPAMRRALQPAYDYAKSNAGYDPNNKSGIHMRETLRIDARVPNASDRKSAYVDDNDAVIGVLSVKKSAVSLANEFGTAKMAKRPFLVPALQQTINQALGILSGELSEILPSYMNQLSKKKGVK